MNHYAVDGRLVADPELRKTNDGTSVLRFRIAHNERNRTLFLTCEAWGTGAEVIADRFRKGSPINLSGFLRQEQWTDKEGGKRSEIILRVEQHGRPLGSGIDERPVSAERRSTDDVVASIASRHDRDDSENSDDIPF